MAVDVTNTQTGNAPEVHEISKDTDRFDKNVKVPVTEQSPLVSGTQAVPEQGLVSSTEEVSQPTKQEGDPIPLPVPQKKNPNWDNIYSHVSNLEGFDKNITLDNMISKSSGNDELLKNLRKQLAMSTYGKETDIQLGKDFDEFKSLLYPVDRPIEDVHQAEMSSGSKDEANALADDAVIDEVDKAQRVFDEAFAIKPDEKKTEYDILVEKEEAERSANKREILTQASGRASGLKKQEEDLTRESGEEYKPEETEETALSSVIGNVPLEYKEEKDLSRIRKEIVSENLTEAHKEEAWLSDYIDLYNENPFKQGHTKASAIRELKLLHPDYNSTGLSLQPEGEEGPIFLTSDEMAERYENIRKNGIQQDIHSTEDYLKELLDGKSNDKISLLKDEDAASIIALIKRDKGVDVDESTFNSAWQNIKFSKTNQASLPYTIKERVRTIARDNGVNLSGQDADVIEAIKMQEVNKDMEYAMSHLSDEQRQLFSLQDKVNRLRLEINTTKPKEGDVANRIEKMNEVASLSKQIKLLQDSPKEMYDINDGTWKHVGDVEDKTYQDVVIKAAAKYKTMPVDILVSKWQESMARLKHFEKLFDEPLNYEMNELGEKGGRIFSMDMSTRDFVGSQKPDIYTKIVPHGDVSKKQLESRKSAYDEAKKDFDALNYMVMLNQDPSGRKTFTGGTLREGVGGFIESMVEGAFEGFGGEVDSDADVAKNSINQLKSMGVRLSEEQESIIEEDLSTAVAEGIGSSIPAMTELILTSIIATPVVAGVSKLSRASKAMNIVKTALTQKSGRAGRFVYNTISGGLEGAFVYGLTSSEDITASMGFGEGAASKIVGGLNIAKKYGGKWGIIIENLAKIGGGTTTETISEFVGEFTDELNKTGYNWSKAFDKTFGETGDEFTKKLATTGIISMMFSTAFNLKIGGAVINTLQQKKADPEIIEALQQQYSQLEAQLSEEGVGLGEAAPVLPTEDVELEETLGVKRKVEKPVEKVAEKVVEGVEPVKKVEVAEEIKKKEVKEEVSDIELTDKKEAVVEAAKDDNIKKLHSNLVDAYDTDVATIEGGAVGKAKVEKKARDEFKAAAKELGVSPKAVSEYMESEKRAKTEGLEEGVPFPKEEEIIAPAAKVKGQKKAKEVLVGKQKISPEVSKLKIEAFSHIKAAEKAEGKSKGSAERKAQEASSKRVTRSVNQAYGKKTPEFISKVNEELGTKGKTLPAIAKEYIKDNETVNNFVQSITKIEGEEKIKEAETAKIAEQQAKKGLKTTQESVKEYDLKISEGKAHEKSKDYKAAYESYREARELSPSVRMVNPDAYVDANKKMEDASRKVSSVASATVSKAEMAKKEKKKEFAKRSEAAKKAAATKITQKQKPEVIKSKDLTTDTFESAIEKASNLVDNGGKPLGIKINGTGIENTITNQIKSSDLPAEKKSALIKKMSEVSDKYKEKLSKQKDIEKAAEEDIKYEDTQSPNIVVEKKTSEQRSNSARASKFISTLINRLEKAFPEIGVYSDKKSYDKKVEANGWSQDRIANNVAFYDHSTNEIYINPEKANEGAVLEEFAHLWTVVAKTKAKAIYNKGIQLVKDSPYHAETVEHYKDLAHRKEDGTMPDNNEILHEALGKAIADKGLDLIENESKFKEWVNKLFKYIGRLMKINPRINLANTSLDDFTTLAAKELLKGEKLADISSKKLSEELKGGTMPFKIDRSILSDRNKWGVFKSWKNHWLKKGVSSELYDSKGEFKGNLAEREKKGQLMLIDFQKKFNQYKKDYKSNPEGKVDPDEVWDIVGSALNTKAGILKVPKELLNEVQSMKEFISGMSKEILEIHKEAGQDITELEVSFNENEGMYIHRTYMKYDIPEYHKKYKKIFSEEQIIDALKSIKSKFSSNNISRIEWKETASGDIDLYFTNRSGIGSNFGESIRPSEDAFNVFEVMFGEEIANVINNEIAVARKAGKTGDQIAIGNLSAKGDLIDFSISTADAESILESLLDVDTKGETLALASSGTGTVKKADLSVLKKRADLDPAIRVIYGEYTDPATNFLRTSMKMSGLIEKMRFETELKSNGTGTLFTETKDNITNTVFIGKEKSKQLGGLWTSPEMYSLLFDRPQNILTPFKKGFVTEGKTKLEAESEVAALFKTLNSYQKANLTILSPGSQSRNMIGAFINLGTTGHLPKHLFEAAAIVASEMTAGQKITGSLMNPYFGMLYAASLTMGEKFKGTSKENIRKQIIRMTKERMMDESVEASIIEEIVEGIYHTKAVTGKTEGLRVKSKKIYSDFMKMFSKPYQATDAMFKISQFMGEVNTLKDIYGDTKTDAEIDKEAAKLVRLEQPTYSESPELLKTMSKSLFIADFILFDYQTYRNKWNILKSISNFSKAAKEESIKAKDLKEAGDDVNSKVHKERASKLRKQAARRMVGLSTMMLTGTAARAFFMSLHGLTDEDDEAIAENMAPWAKNSSRLYMNDDKKNPKFFDLSYVDPSSNIHKMFTAASRADGVFDGMYEAAKEASGPYRSPSIFGKRVFELITGYDERGNPISPANASFESWITNRLYHLTKGMEPTAYRDVSGIIEDIFKDEKDIKKSDRGKITKWKNELLNTNVGVKLKEYSMIDNYSFTNWALKETISNVLNNYKNGDESLEFTEAKLKDILGTMNKKYESMKQLGFSDYELKKKFTYKTSSGKTTTDRIGLSLFENAKKNKVIEFDKETGRLETKSSKKSNLFN